MFTGFPRTIWPRRRFSESYATWISVKISLICEFRVIMGIMISLRSGFASFALLPRVLDEQHPRSPAIIPWEYCLAHCPWTTAKVVWSLFSEQRKRHDITIRRAISNITLFLARHVTPINDNPYRWEHINPVSRSLLTFWGWRHHPLRNALWDPVTATRVRWKFHNTRKIQCDAVILKSGFSNVFTIDTP